MVVHVFHYRLHQQPGTRWLVRDDVDFAPKKANLFIKQRGDWFSDQRQRAGVSLVRVQDGVHIRSSFIDRGVHGAFNGGLALTCKRFKVEIEHANIADLHMQVIQVGGCDRQRLV